MLAELDGTWGLRGEIRRGTRAHPLADAAARTAGAQVAHGRLMVRIFPWTSMEKMAMPDAGGKMTENGFQRHVAGRLRQREEEIHLHVDRQHGYEHHVLRRVIRPRQQGVDLFPSKRNSSPGMKTKGRGSDHVLSTRIITGWTGTRSTAARRSRRWRSATLGRSRTKR